MTTPPRQPVPTPSAPTPGPAAPAPRITDSVQPITLPPYSVMLHNDDVNSMDHVVHALLASVPELEPEEAVQIMITAHEGGVARVITCTLERAELYRERLESQGLTATIEKG
ncbi:MAG TPA: ATP-dependent Clp protease adaptor ClpS [Dehalococcoidia bacterium]|nr:ATP-dependent Clp protease adaptor ClpS [Dehalococcoidia bacterium]